MCEIDDSLTMFETSYYYYLFSVVIGYNNIDELLIQINCLLSMNQFPCARFELPLL